MKFYLKLVMVVVLIFNSKYVFSQNTQEDSLTEAGICADPNDCTPNSQIQTLKGTIDEQLCQATQNKSECKEIDKGFLKGCDSSGVLAKLGEGGLQCGVGVIRGVRDLLAFYYDLMVKELGFKSKEDPGLKAFLHAEFEDASQDFGNILASTQVMAVTTSLMIDAIGDVYSCLNGVGVAKKVCQYITGAGITAIPLYVLIKAIAAGAVAGTTALAKGAVAVATSDVVVNSAINSAIVLGMAAPIVTIFGSMMYISAPPRGSPMIREERKEREWRRREKKEAQRLKDMMREGRWPPKDVGFLMVQGNYLQGEYLLSVVLWLCLPSMIKIL